ncbi:SDR family NAD(P)-dependent oxidoreductase [Nocardioides perillae]|uniref:NADP-dependent 3-hydroxy acid dehydrogenase YdfG n=1 Tax=Nocardioides perillae TaxID=1119534 RepID=A0A7Y9RVM8_9ACTN|nr:SDR family oxidoreductase [Nocardioides perillae]NYG54785.1 NADP-dependent 3-hydroxy acid dehydrogenase YdfG [Nocardioides perillae]
MSDAPTSATPAATPAAGLPPAPTEGLDARAYAGRTAGRVAVVTGASSGIGAASARALAAAGFRVVCAARRADRVEALASEIGGLAVACDVTDRASVEALAAAAGDLGDGVVHVLVNNAGGAFGSDPVESADPEQWRAMYDVNVLGTLHVTQALLPLLRASGDGLVLNMGSTAGRIAYEGGAGYTAAKHGTQVVTETLRLELCGEPVRVTEIAPGMVQTEEFSLVRFGGDADAAARVYEGVADPLRAEDVADAVAWVATRPAHVNVDEMVIRPRAQAAQHKVHRV